MSEPLDSRLRSTRSELERTLDEIEDRLNVPKRVQSSYKKDPVPWIIGATAAVVVIGGIVAWAIFSDD